jgi:two-component sensor histidine kinase
MPTPGASLSLRRLCEAQTPLSANDIDRIEQLGANLELFADLAQADVFIDCPTRSSDVAIVVAQATPSHGRSLYRTPVAGQLALRENEPAVIDTLLTGRPALGSRGLTQEGTPVRQSVVPIAGEDGRTIGALIMEQDITEQLKQEARVGALSRAAEQLTETLLSSAMTVQTLPSLMHEGLMIVNPRGLVLYANPTAAQFVRDLGGPDDPTGHVVQELGLGFEPDSGRSGVVTRELEAACASFTLRAVPITSQQDQVGYIILLRDITEVRVKEKALMVKSAVIKEIHHRVKNNLQTIASLLRLQARRVENDEVRQIFAESINRICSIATVHEVLSKDGIDRVDLTQMASDIVRLVRGAMLQPERAVTVAVEGDSIAISSHKATSVALILNELVQNALEHAFTDQETGKVLVAIANQGRTIRVSVRDDGPGVSTDRLDESNGRLGLQIVRTLVEHDLKGSLSIQGQSGAGTEVCVVFPKAEVEERHVRGESAVGGR